MAIEKCELMMASAQAQGIFTDEDVFTRVS